MYTASPIWSIGSGSSIIFSLKITKNVPQMPIFSALSLAARSSHLSLSVCLYFIPSARLLQDGEVFHELSQDDTYRLPICCYCRVVSAEVCGDFEAFVPKPLLQMLREPLFSRDPH